MFKMKRITVENQIDGGYMIKKDVTYRNMYSFKEYEDRGPSFG